MTERATGRPVESVRFEGPDLLMTFADGPRETVRLVNAYPVSHRVNYPADSGVVVDEMTGWAKDAP